MYTSQIQQNTRYGKYAVYTHAYGVWAVFLEYGRGPLGIFKSPAFTYNQSCPPFRFTVYFLPEQAQRATYAARGAKRLVYVIKWKNVSCEITISSKLIFASCVGYFDRAYYGFYVTSSRCMNHTKTQKLQLLPTPLRLWRPHIFTAAVQAQKKKV